MPLPFLKKKNMKINDTFPPKKKGLSVNYTEEKGRYLLCKISQPGEIQNESLGPVMAIVEIQQTQGWQPCPMSSCCLGHCRRNYNREWRLGWIQGLKWGRDKPVFMLPPKSLIAVELEFLCLFKKYQGTTFFSFFFCSNCWLLQIPPWIYYGKLGQIFLLISQVHACWGFMLENKKFLKDVYSRNLSH